MKKITLLLFVLSIKLCFAQDGHIDPTFNPGDRGNGYGDGMGTCTAMALQPDGKVLLGAYEDLYNGRYDGKSFFRVNADGDADATFNIDGTGPMFGDVNAVVVLSSGKILIAGTFTNYNGTAINRIARLNANGTLDETFTVGEGADGEIRSMALLPNGKIVITGEFTKYNNISRTRIAVLNVDGSLYTSFNPNSGPNYPVTAVAVQADGKILISGSFTYYNVTPVSSLVRINANGSIDNSFTPPNAIRGNISVLANGKILGINTDNRYIYRLNSTGTLDNTFNFGYAGIEYECRNIYPLPDGKIIASMLFKNDISSTDDDVKKLVRLNSDGSSDNSFYIGSGTTTYDLDKYAVQSDGRLLVSGFFVNYNDKIVKGVMRLNTDGTYDPSFNGGTNGSNGEVTDIMMLPNGKMIIQGPFSEYNDVRTRVAKLNTDGTVDTSFTCNISTNDTPQPINAIALQADGKILVGGIFTFRGSTVSNIFKRLNSDGSIDSSFNYTIITETINAIAVQPDGKILISGKFPTFFPFPSAYRVFRLNADGTVDSTFDANSKGNSSINNITIQPDGKIVLSGEFTTYNDTAAVRMVRLEANGAIDASFNVGLGFNSTPNSIVLQTDGKIVASGFFSSFNNTSVNQLVRLNSNGTIDTTFNIGSGPSSSIYTLALQPDGKILVGGLFTTFNAQTKYFIVRLNGNGSIDNSFNTVGGGPNYSVRKIALQADGKPVIGGLFVNYNGIGRNRLARLNPVVLGIEEFPESSKKVSVYPNPVKNILHIEYHTSIQSIAVFDFLGKMVINKSVNANQLELDMSGLDSALYFIKVITSDGIQNFKIFKE
ncbi:T9SS type A sorting domain-containing protein [Flavobacterium sangjuense]|nr:T9SS type A sorting domain-containing protein [Flavobacterium sangjuense]